jgi:hypothetical protein
LSKSIVDIVSAFSIFIRQLTAFDIIRLTIYNMGGPYKEMTGSVEYILAKETAEKWGVSERRIQKLCEESRIPGIIRFSRVWAIPKGAEKPDDARCKVREKSFLYEARK